MKHLEEKLDLITLNKSSNTMTFISNKKDFSWW
ncbi:hypothetical protein M948_14710 [Virgibacillus sp. CM-4]|nr:hypothetical protein M948_14710 [Virgibacillus sp. CM-4]